MKLHKKLLTAIFAGSMLLTSPMAMADDLGSLTKKAQKGNVDAQYALGMFYLSGNKAQEGIVWLEKAARKGHKDALFMAGLAYASPESGLPENYNKAQAYVKDACERGHKKACELLSQLK